MKNILTSFFILINSIFLITGCSSSEPEEKNHYRFDIIDSVLNKSNGKITAVLHSYGPTYCKRYNIFNFDYYLKEKYDLDTIYFFVISRKENFSDSIEYKLMNIGESYNLNLIKIDTSITAIINVPINGPHKCLILEPNLLFWRDGKIVAKCYYSNEIKDVYIKKQ
jgi:hypothetical protein